MTFGQRDSMTISFEGVESSRIEQQADIKSDSSCIAAHVRSRDIELAVAFPCGVYSAKSVVYSQNSSELRVVF